MLNPPKDVEPSALFKKLLETPRPSEVVPFPRKDENGEPIDHVRIIVLTSEEHDKCRERATRYFTEEKKFNSDQMKTHAMRGALSDRIAYEMLVFSCHTAGEQGTDNNTGQPLYPKIFHSPDDVRKVLSAHEIEVLYDSYQLVQDKFGPREHDTNVDMWVERLREGGQHYPLLSLDLAEHVSLTSSLVDRVSSMSDVLESLWNELPPTCQSALERFCLDTTSPTSPLSESERNPSTESSSLDIDDALGLGEKQRATSGLLEATDPDPDD